MYEEQVKSFIHNRRMYTERLDSTHAFRNTLLLNRVLVEHAEAAAADRTRYDTLAIQLENISRQVIDMSILPREQRRTNDLLQASSERIVAEVEQTRTQTQAIQTQQIQIQPAAAQVAQPEMGLPIGGTHSVITTTNTATETTISRYKLDFSTFQKLSCTPSYSCSCHLRSRYRTPSFIQKIVRTLMVGFSSLPFVGTQCSEPSCSQQSPFSATFSYCFPAWFVSRVISLVLITTVSGDPAACIKVRPTMFTDFSMFRFASRNNIEGLKSLIERKLGHPRTSWQGSVISSYR